ncbi:MAG: polysaccharide biosynthesis C-terminal domain-containing protein [Acidimicrobiia bacterium]|nr:polysaccharide biosynthesis C-terminal domain-containing protein [Acidimicrobiia bacterium]
MALSLTYAAERAVVLAVILIAVLSGAQPGRVGELEIALAAGSFGATVGPLGTTTALMHERFRSRQANITLAIAIGTGGGFIIGSLLAIQLGLIGMLAGGLFGIGLSWNRVAQNRMRVEGPRDNVGVTIPLLAGFAVVMTLVWVLDGATADIAPLAVCAGGLAALVSMSRLLRPRLKTGRAQFGEMMRFGIPLSLGAIAFWVVASADRYLIGWMMDLEAVGVYAPLYRVSMLFSGAAATLVVWWRAESLRLGATWAGDRLRRFVSLALPLTLAGALLTWWPLTRFLAGIVDHPDAEIAAVVGWLLISVVAWTVASGLLVPMVAASEVKDPAVVWIVAAAANVGLNLLLIPAFGLPGAAAATAAAQAVAVLQGYRAVQRLRSRTSTRE